MGTWVFLKHHTCQLPDRQQLFDLGIIEGSVYKCTCGQLWMFKEALYTGRSERPPYWVKVTEQTVTWVPKDGEKQFTQYVEEPRSPSEKKEDRLRYESRRRGLSVVDDDF